MLLYGILHPEQHAIIVVFLSPIMCENCYKEYYYLMFIVAILKFSSHFEKKNVLNCLSLNISRKRQTALKFTEMSMIGQDI